MALALAKAGCVVTGLDPSAELLAKARAASAAEGQSIEHVEGVAEELPFEDSSYDLVTAATCCNWFDQTAAAREAARALTPHAELSLSKHRPFDELRVR